MTSANGSSAPLGRRCQAAFPRALPRGARPPGPRARSLRRRSLAPVGAVALLGTLSLAPAPAAAQEPSPRAACLRAVRIAETVHDIPPGLLVAMALNESGLHAFALNIAGRAHYPATRAEARELLLSARGSVMAGCVQVNARVHAVGSDWPLDAPRAADWAARYLRRYYDQSGDWVTAVVRWHGGSPRNLTAIICRVRSKMDVTAPRSSLFRDRCPGVGAEVARLRRNGSALLELAEAAER